MDQISNILGMSGVSLNSLTDSRGLKGASLSADDSVALSGSEETEGMAGTFVAAMDEETAEANAEKLSREGRAKGAAAAEANAKLEAAQNDLEEVEAEGEHEGKEANTEENLNELNEELENLEEEREQKLKEQEELEARQAELVEELAEARANGDEAKIVELTGELNSVNQKLDSLNNDLQSMDNKIGDVRNSIDSTRQQLQQEIKDKQQAQQDKIEAAQQAKQKASAEAQQADAQADRSQQSASEANKSVDQLKGEVAQARADAAQKSQAAAQADAEVEAAKAQLESSKSQTITNENGETVPDQAAIDAAQANLDAKESAAKQAHAAADAAKADVNSKEIQLASAQSKAKQADTKASQDAAAAQAANTNASKASEAANNARSQQAASSPVNSGGGSAPARGGGGSVGHAGRSGGSQAASKAGGVSAITDGDGGVVDKTGVLESAVNVDFSDCSQAEVASGIEGYAKANGYDFPSGFGEEFVRQCDEKGVDYGLALAICQNSGFGKNGEGLFGLGDKSGKEADWKSELSDGLAQLASLRDSGGSSSKKTVYDQLSAIGSSLHNSSFSDSVYKNYTEGVSPSMLADVKGATTDYDRLVSGIEAAGKRGKQGNLYKTMAKKDGITVEEAKAQVQARLDAVKEKYGSGRDTAVLSGLTLMNMAAQYGIKLTYGASPAKGLAAGIDPAETSDCRNWVSWGVDQGNDGDVPSWNVGQLLLGYKGGPENVVRHGVGDYSQLMPGDAIGRGSDHVAMVIANDPQARTITVSEASGHGTGVNLRTMSYKRAIELNYIGTDMSSYYH